MPFAMPPPPHLTLNTPLGWLRISGMEHGVQEVSFLAGPGDPLIEASATAPACLIEAASQLNAYFQGRLLTFNLPLAPTGTCFQRQVWQETSQIPYGQTVTYQWLAQRLGKPGASRAVGQALNRNPLAIVIPCHRVVGTSGQLTGYAGGLARKQFLLKHEHMHN